MNIIIESELMSILQGKERMEKCILSLLKLYNSEHHIDEEHIVRTIINETVELTQSECGYLHLFHSDSDTIELKVWSDSTLKYCNAVHDNHYPISSAGIWADCARLKRPVVHNDYVSYPDKKGIPEGHFPITRHLSVPVVDNENVVVIIGVGNKQTDYTQFDVDQMSIIAANLWNILKNKRYEAQIRKLINESKYDHVTSAFTRREFENILSNFIDNSTTQARENTVLAYIDIDNFKLINDNYGHFVGDIVLRKIVEYLHQIIRKSDAIGRIGGDELAIIFRHCDMSQAVILANKLLKSLLDKPVTHKGNSFRVGLSIGLSCVYSKLEETILNADIACYLAKINGKNQVKVYDESDSEVMTRKTYTKIAADIENVIANHRLALFVQPMFFNRKDRTSCTHSSMLSNLSHTVTDCMRCKNAYYRNHKPIPVNNDKYSFCNMYEALLRVKVNDQFTSPVMLLSAAELYGYSNKIDYWVVTHLFERFGHESNVLIFINLSTKSLCDLSFAEYIEKLFISYKYNSKNFCFEVTETTAIKNISIAKQFITKIMGLGCSFALDDFGNGFSSYAYLKDLPVNFIKIDGMFVRDIDTNDYSEKIVENIISLATYMGIDTIAECVETESISNKLIDLGVSFIQGYYMEKPFSINELTKNDGNTSNVMLPSPITY